MSDDGVAQGNRARRRRCSRRSTLVVLVVLVVGALTSPAGAAARDPFAGRGMWIWYLSRSSGGSIAAIIDTARQYGIRTLMIKSADGTSFWSQFNSQLVSRLHAAGLRVCAWQYVYGQHPISEAFDGAAAVHDGADCLIVDAESEYQGKYVQAQTYFAWLRKLVGASYPVALAGLPYVDYHPGFPYSVFLGRGGAQYNMPQMYWLDIGASVDQVYAHTYAFNLPYGRPIAPVGQLYGSPTPGQILRFRQLSGTYGAAGVSWWDWAWAGATRAGWRWVSQPASPLAAPSSVPVAASIGRGAVGDLVVWAQEHLLGAGYRVSIDGGFGPTTLAAVSAFQLAHGLAVDGVIGPETWRALLRYAPARVVWSSRGAQTASAASSSLTLPVPKSARLPAKRNEIAGPGDPK